MALVWDRDQISVPLLASHLQDSGFSSAEVDENSIWLRTESGIGFSVAILDHQDYIRISTYLPLRAEEDHAKKLDLEHRMNSILFLPVFCLDRDNDMAVAYVLHYGCGLIAGQFTATVNRFASLLEYIAANWNDDGLVDFQKYSKAPADVLLN